MPRRTGGVSADAGAAFEGKVIRSIDVAGLKRIEKDAVLAKLVSKPGQNLASTTVQQDIQAIFKMAWKRDVLLF